MNQQDKLSILEEKRLLSDFFMFIKLLGMASALSFPRKTVLVGFRLLLAGALGSCILGPA